MKADFLVREFGFACIAVCIGASSLYAQDVRDLEKTSISVAQQTGKAVVSISSVARRRIGYDPLLGSFGDDAFRRFIEDFFGESPEQEARRIGLGSGVIVSNDGYIVTNAHVIAGANEIKVKLSDGREFDAVTIGVDPVSDIAVIKVTAGNLPALSFGDSEALAVGSFVFALGNPFGFAITNPEPTLTMGVVSALHRDVPALGRRAQGYDDLIQTDAAINPGNSGGPLVNLQGEIIGINTAIISTSGGYQGLGFAVPAATVKKVYVSIVGGESVAYGWLGVSIQDVNEDLRAYFNIAQSKGVIVVKVYTGSPAALCGIAEGDLIVSFAGKQVQTSRDLARFVSLAEVGKSVPVTIMREGARKQLNIIVARQPSEGSVSRQPDAARDTPIAGALVFRGMTVDEITPQLRHMYDLDEESGVAVVRVAPGSQAEQSGVEPGDSVIKIGGMRITSKKDFQTAVGRIKKGSALLQTNRGFFVIKE